jgi:hypothetical protein
MNDIVTGAAEDPVFDAPRIAGSRVVTPDDVVPCAPDNVVVVAVVAGDDDVVPALP